jgi:DNA-binding Lrp family transcriptional regulator
VLSPEPERGHSEAAEYLLELLTVDEIAAALRVSPSWVYERVRKRGRDKISHLKIGKYLRFRLNEVRIWGGAMDSVRVWGGASPGSYPGRDTEAAARKIQRRLVLELGPAPSGLCSMPRRWMS